MIVPALRCAPMRRRESYRLRGRYHRQFRERETADAAALVETVAVTFRPGDRTSTFYDKALRPLGSAVLVVLTNGTDEYEPILSGYRAMLHSDGSVGYGLADDYEFRHRADLKPGIYGALDPERNPSLFDTLLRLDQACAAVQPCADRFPNVPKLPRILLGFDPAHPPTFEITPALERAAATEIGVPPSRLATNPPELVERLIRQCWEAKLLPPGAARNPTELILIDAELCTQARQAVRCFEDFSSLLGAVTWNPARDAKPLVVDNPAPRILAEHGVDPAEGYDDVDGELVMRLETAMRAELSDSAERFSQEDLFDGLTEPRLPLVAASEALPRLRKRLTPFYSECTTDRDLRTAARRRDEPLRASGACRIQVLRKRPTTEPFFFSEDDLSRRIRIDWGTTAPCRAKRSKSQLPPAVAR